MRYGVLTNGQRWKMYDADTTTKSPKIEFDITDSDGVVLSKAIRLHKSVVLEGAPRPEPPSTPGNIQGIALTNLTYNKGDRPPKSLIHRDGSKKVLESWVDLLAGVAEWLINDGYLAAQDCPVRLGSKNYLHTEPIHPNGKPFSTHRKIGGLYVFTDVSGGSNCIKYAKKLIEKAGLKPSDFKVDRQDYTIKDG